MTTKIKHTGRSHSIPGGIAISAAASILTTVVFSAVIAYFLNKERLTWEQAGYWIMGMLYFSSFIGAKFAIAAVKRPKIALSVMSGMLYWGLLMCATALLFGGDFGAVWVTLGIIAAGSGCAAILVMPAQRKYRKKQGNIHR